MKSRHVDLKKNRAYEMEDDSDSDSVSESSTRDDPQAVLQDLLKEFPNIGCDLKQLLQLIDGGKAVDINGIAQMSLIKPLRTLFLSLNLKELNHGAFVLPPNVCPTLEVIGSIISPPLDHVAPPQRRPIGPETPSEEILAAAAKLREAEAELREAELEEKEERVFIGPGEVTRIMEAEEDSPYDIMGSNSNVSPDSIRKRYWKLSLLVHPDKCSHPHANQAFVKLNKAFKELQNPEKRREIDEKIELKKKQTMLRRSISGWSDGLSERARKAKMDYFQAYNEFTKLASKEEERKRSLDAELMNRYKEEKRSKSLLQKHKEEMRARRLKRKHSKQQEEEEEWVGKHPWKPWDREKDLAGGRQSVKLDSEYMTRGLSSRFSGGSYQRNFL